MRPDFNKLLTERERLGHGMKFHEVRGAKGNRTFDEDAVGGKESIHRRRRESLVPRKRFNENLNPLKDFLRTNTGRPWDKVYGDICKAFDKRKVINNHILEHLFQYVETKDLEVIEGKVYWRSNWRGLVPIKESYSEWYVDPRDGILKKTSKQPKHSVKKLEEAARAKKIDAVFKVINRDAHLILSDNIWWVYEIKDTPEPVREWSAPSHMTEWTWSKLSEEEKQKEGCWVWVRPKYEAISAPRFGEPGKNRHYASRTQANSKVLKAMGVSGLTEFDETVRLSHRQASKYRTR